MDMKDYRVLFEYLDPDGHPHFEFTTALGPDSDHASDTVAGMHKDDVGFRVVQVEESNGRATGYTPEEVENAKATYAARGKLG